MKNTTLKGRNIAMVVAHGFQEEEMSLPRSALEKAGANVTLISPDGKSVKAWKDGKWSKTYKASMSIKQAKGADFDGIVLPGGVMNPDLLRTEKKVVAFIKHFMQQKKPVAAICHGPWTLIETGLLKGRKLTSYHSIKTDLKNAGALWSDKKVMVDRNLVTSRKPSDISAFNKAIIKQYS